MAGEGAAMEVGDDRPLMIAGGDGEVWRPVCRVDRGGELIVDVDVVGGCAVGGGPGEDLRRKGEGARGDRRARNGRGDG